MPGRIRNTGRLINAIDGMSKWRFGAQNRKTLLLLTNDKINEQIKISKYFATALKHLKENVKSERLQIKEELNSINKFMYHEYKQNLNFILSCIRHKNI